MFTGLVQAVGEVAAREPLGEGARFRVRVPPAFAAGLREGESVAVDGVCLTVSRPEPPEFEVEVIRTTLSRTTLAGWEPGRRVNLERALAAGDALGGHLVQGHVDAVARVEGVERTGETVRLALRLPPEVARLTVPLGSLAVDGVSLTVNALRGDVADLAIIPYTWSHTALSRLAAGETTNVEADLIGKYVDRLLRPYAEREGTAAGAHPQRG